MCGVSLSEFDMPQEFGDGFLQEICGRYFA
jgi:hypothetical protein